jgi:hypothetical protein
MKLQNVHGWSLATSTALSGYYRVKGFIPPIQVIRVLRAIGVKFMLIGAHGLGGWTGAPRATQDVDVLVGQRGYKKAVKALLAAFPHLEADDQEVVTRLCDPETGQVVIDVIKPNQPLYRVGFKHTHTVEVEGERYEVPSLEMALAMKFGPMVSPNRPIDRKYQDAADFIRMAKTNADIDMEQLAELGELVYPGGGKEIVQFVAQARAGERLKL